jgi:hypothetical protein
LSDKWDLMGMAEVLWDVMVYPVPVRGAGPVSYTRVRLVSGQGCFGGPSLDAVDPAAEGPGNDGAVAWLERVVDGPHFEGAALSLTGWLREGGRWEWRRWLVRPSMP